MISGTKTVGPRRLYENNEFSLKFIQGTDEDLRKQWSKCCDDNNKTEHNSPNIDNNILIPE